MGEQKNNLSNTKRVALCRKKLKKIGLYGAKRLFVLKFKNYAPKKEDPASFNRLDNLYYGKISDDTFTENLEEFVILMQHTFK